MNRYQAGMMGVLTLLLGFKSVQVTSKVRAGYSRNIDQVCIALAMPQDKNPSIALSAKDALEMGLKDWKIRKAVVLLDGGTGDQAAMPPAFTAVNPGLDAATLQAKAGFKPTFLMRVHMGSAKVHLAVKGASGSKDVRSLQLALIELESGQAVWKAELWVKASSNTFEDFKDIGALITEQLGKDGLLGGPGKK